MVAGVPPNRWVCLACPKWSHIQLRFHFSAQPFKKSMNEILKHTQAFFFPSRPWFSPSPKSKETSATPELKKNGTKSFFFGGVRPFFIYLQNASNFVNKSKRQKKNKRKENLNVKTWAYNVASSEERGHTGHKTLKPMLARKEMKKLTFAENPAENAVFFFASRCMSKVVLCREWTVKS